MLAIAIVVGIVSGGEGGLVDTSQRYRLTIGIAFLLTGAGTLVTAAIAIFRDGERSLLTRAALLFGLASVGFMLADALIAG